MLYNYNLYATNKSRRYNIRFKFKLTKPRSGNKKKLVFIINLIKIRGIR